MIIFDYGVFNKFHFLIVLDNCFESNMLLILLSVTMYLHWEMINIFPLGNYQYISTGKLSIYFHWEIIPVFPITSYVFYEHELAGLLPLGRVPPGFLVGEGAKEWAARHGIQTVKSENLISDKAAKLYKVFFLTINATKTRFKGRFALLFLLPISSF